MIDSIYKFIYEYAYIPEHLPNYFISFSDSKLNFNYKNQFIYYYSKNDLRIIGYPLKNNFQENIFIELLTKLVNQYKPNILGVITPKKLINYPYKINHYEFDHYYILHIKRIKMNKKLRNIIKRAEREVVINITREIKSIHKRLIKDFCKRKRISNTYVKMFSKIPNYIKSSRNAYVIEAWKKDKLIAFTIYENVARKYGFYLFNFTSKKEEYIPGTSDLLFKKCVEIALESGKEYINMGLGINEGVKYFKSKWGAKPTLEYNCIITYFK